MVTTGTVVFTEMVGRSVVTLVLGAVVKDNDSDSVVVILVPVVVGTEMDVIVEELSGRVVLVPVVVGMIVIVSEADDEERVAGTLRVVVAD